MARRQSVRRKSAGRRLENGVASHVDTQSKNNPHFNDMVDDLPFEMTMGTDPETQKLVEKAVGKVEEKIEKAIEAQSQAVDEQFIKTAADQPQFSLTPGDGWLFYQVGREDTYVWQGHMNVPPYGPLFAVAKLNTTEGKYEVTLRKGREEKYALVCEFYIPQLKDQKYVDAEMSVPLPEPVEAQGMKVTHRKYLVRAFRDNRPTQENILRIQLPAIRESVRRANVPM